MNALEPRIFVAFKSVKKPEFEVGAWIDAVESKTQLEDSINWIRKQSPIKLSEDWRVRSFENFGRCENDLVSDSPDELAKVAKLLRTYGWLGAEVLKRCIVGNPSAAEALNFIETCYLGAFSSPAEFAKYYIKNKQDLPEQPEKPIKYSEYGKKLFKEFITIKLQDKKTHVFNQYLYPGFYYYDDDGYYRYLFDYD